MSGTPLGLDEKSALKPPAPEQATGLPEPVTTTTQLVQQQMQLQQQQQMQQQKNQPQQQQQQQQGDGDWEIGGDPEGEEGEGGSEGSSPTNTATSVSNFRPSGADKISRTGSGMVRADSHGGRHGHGGVNGFAMKMGITSSPSFQELERAIGESLAMNLTHSSSSASLAGDSDAGDSRMARGHSSSPLNSRLSGTDMTLQKAQGRKGGRTQPLPQRYSPSQMMQQKSPTHVLMAHPHAMNMYHSQHAAAAAYHHHHHHHQMNVPKPEAKTPLDARTELAVHINESESRALILFHSPDLSPVTVRDACQKFGVLYYIRPEFHSKGVTLLSYFDLRLAIRAQASLPEELGDEHASVHFSIMLHATNSNTEEYRLVVQNLPEGRAEMTEVENIFARYGQLRSIQRIFSDAGDDIGGSRTASTTSAFSIEYFNIQDARLAASELGATTAQLWGPDIIVGFAPLDTRKQLLCRQLLGTLSRWRSELSPPIPSQMNQMPMMFPQESFGYGSTHSVLPPMMFTAGYGNMMHMSIPMHQVSYTHHQGAAVSSFAHPAPGVQMSGPIFEAPRRTLSSGDLVSQHMQQSQGQMKSQQERTSPAECNDSDDVKRYEQQQQQQQLVQSPTQSHQQIYSEAKSAGGGAVPNSVLLMNRNAYQASPSSMTAFEQQRPQHHNGGHGRKPKNLGSEEQDFMLSIDRLKVGEDRRTTVMVRFSFVSFVCLFAIMPLHDF